MDSKASINYEEALDMLLKSLEKNEVFQLRRHISKLGVFIGGILLFMDIILMGYVISLKTEIAEIKQLANTSQQILITETTPTSEPTEEVTEETEPTVIETPIELTEDSKEQKMQEYIDAVTDLLERQEVSEAWFKEYLDITSQYEDVVDLPEQFSEVFNEAEQAIVYSCVETEVHGGDFASKVHVADVIFNRLEAGKWGDSVTSVITSPGQFTYNKAAVQDSTKFAVQYAFMFPDTTQGAIYFNKSIVTSSPYYLFTDDVGHSFYLDKDSTNYIENEIILNSDNDEDSVG